MLRNRRIGPEACLRHQNSAPLAAGWLPRKPREAAREGQAAALLELAGAEIYSPRGDPAEAERHLLSALDLAKSSGEPDFEARVHVSLANVYAYRIGNVLAKVKTRT